MDVGGGLSLTMINGMEELIYRQNQGGGRGTVLHLMVHILSNISQTRNLGLIEVFSTAVCPIDLYPKGLLSAT